jgi:hypothetical protein
MVRKEKFGRGVCSFRSLPIESRATFAGECGASSMMIDDCNMGVGTQRPVDSGLSRSRTRSILHSEARQDGRPEFIGAIKHPLDGNTIIRSRGADFTLKAGV